MAEASGIYTITCVVTGDRYLGSSEDIPRRWSTHRSQLKRRVHHSALLQGLFDQFGFEALEFQVIERIPPGRLLEAERGYLAQNSFECNAAYPQKNPMKGRRHTPSSIALMKKNRKGKPGRAKGSVFTAEHRARISAAKTGRPRKSAKLSPETRRRISERMIEIGAGAFFKGKKHSDESRRKMREAAAQRPSGHYRRGASHGSFGKPSWNKGVPGLRGGASPRAKPIEVDGLAYDCVADAARALGIEISTFHKRRRRGSLIVRALPRFRDN